MAANMSGSAEPSTPNLISNTRTKLIAFDKEKKIRYFGPCSNVEINADAKCLILTTNSTVKSLKEVASTFNRIFVQKENALCVIDEGITNKNFMVIFSSKELCDQIFVAINKAKYPRITSPPKNDPTTEDNLFKNNFYVPILKEIKAQIPGFKEIKTTILELVNSFEADKRQIYMNIVFEILVFSTATSDENETGAMQDSTVSSNTTGEGVRKSTVSGNVEIFLDDEDTVNGDGNEESIANNSTLNGSLNSTSQSLNETSNSGYGSRKRSRPNYDEMESFESHEMTVNSLTTTLKKSRLSIPTGLDASTDENQACSETQILPNIISTDYEFVDYFSKGSVRNRLLIFTSKEKTHYYEFYYSTKQEWHACKNCTIKKSSTNIKIISAQNGKIEFLLGQQKHVCVPVKYSPENLVINQKMNLMKIDNTENWKKLCEKRQPAVRKVIKSTDFQFMEAVCNGRNFKKLIIFDENDRGLCRDYSSCGVSKNIKKRYRCRECSTKYQHYVSVYFIKSVDNGNNGDVVELGKSEHLCQPKKVSLNPST